MAWFYQSRTQILRFYWSITPKNNIRTHKNSKFGVFIMKLNQSNFNLRSPDCNWVCSYVITTVKLFLYLKNLCQTDFFFANFRLFSFRSLILSEHKVSETEQKWNFRFDGGKNKKVWYINQCIACDQGTNGLIWKSFEKFSSKW